MEALNEVPVCLANPHTGTVVIYVFPCIQTQASFIPHSLQIFQITLCAKVQKVIWDVCKGKKIPL